MKTLKKIILTLLVILAVILIVAAISPKNMNYEKTITIEAPIAVVWDHVNSLEDLDRLNPWNDHDPKITGTDGTLGASQSWQSHIKEVGNGSQTIAKIEAPTRFETELKFLTPYESEAKGFIQLTDNGETVDATWGFTSEMPWPYNITLLMMDMEKMMGEDWSNGLNKLKTLCEKAATRPIEMNEEMEQEQQEMTEEMVTK